MQKIKMTRKMRITFEKVCNKYLENCMQSNLIEDITNKNRPTKSATEGDALRG